MVKVEMEKSGNLIRFAFETNDEAGLEIIDHLRVAILGSHPKRGGYVDGRRLVIEVKDDSETTTG